MNIQELSKLVDLPVAEQNAIRALIGAGVDISKVKTIHHSSLDVNYNIVAEDYYGNKVQYSISRDFKECAAKDIYAKRKERKDRKSAAYLRAEAFFSV